MDFTISRSKRIHNKMLQLVVLAVLPIALFMLIKPEYLRTNTFFWVCLVTFPFSIQVKKKEAGRPIFWATLIISIFQLALPTSISLFILALLIPLVLLENNYSLSNPGVFVHLFLLSPLFDYFSSLISFPIRLELAKTSGILLELAGFDASVSGNLIYFEGSEFLIDKACAGLHMLGYGLLTGLLIFGLTQRNNQFSYLRFSGYFLLLLSLIAFANITRILLIVLFNIMPELWLHEAVGLMIYLFQVLIPFYFAAKFTSKGPIVHRKANTDLIINLRKYGLIFSLFLIGIVRIHGSNPETTKTIAPSFQDAELLESGTYKISSDSRLIYIKPPVAPYRADHTPVVCWQGSGYEFRKINTTLIHEVEINVAELQKGEDVLHTAWWFESFQHQTGNEWQWRKMSIQNNESFYLINLTCNTQEELIKELSQSIKNGLIKTKK